MNKVFSLVTNIKAQETEKGVNISGMASTMDIDRVGDVILPEAWSKGGLDNYKRNPIVLFNHNYNAPIGKATEVEPTNKGLAFKAFISKAAPNGIAELIKDGVLGAFSVGFIVKDADYIEETGGLKIKDAELFEVSVVSVPANQTATFSIAKSFDSKKEYEEYIETFAHSSESLTDQSLTEEVNASNVDDASEAGTQKNAHMEKTMADNAPEFDRDDLVREAAEKAARVLAMKEAEEKAKAKADAEAEKAAEQKISTSVKAGVAGVEKLISDLEAKFNEKDSNLSEALKELKGELEAKTEELKKLNESKRVFADRSNNMDVKQVIKQNGREFMNAHLFGVITGKGWDTDYAKEVFEKSGLDYSTDTASTGVLDYEVRDMIEKELWVQTRVASLFREIQVNGRATALPLQTDADYAAWAINAPDGNLQNRDNAAANAYKARSVTMTVDRMVSSTYIDNDVDEKTLVNLLPMLFDGVARAHARAIEASIMRPAGAGIATALAHVDDFEANAEDSSSTFSVSGTSSASAALLAGRQAMGKYGLVPSDIAYIVSMPMYYELLQDAEFQNLNEVGEIATKLRGVVGGIFGSPVIVSEEFGDTTAGNAAAYIVNRPNYVIPRLRGVNVETDYEVANQRRMIVASQSLGFTELFDGVTGHQPAVYVSWAT
jgi:HK97 family phage prohead protease